MSTDDPAITTARRNLILGGAALCGTMAAAAAQEKWPTPKPVDEGATSGTKVEFPSIHAESERPGGGPPNPDPPGQRVGFAIMGLGRLALQNVLPAFASCKHARPVALVSGGPQKMSAVAQQYGIAADACYSYQAFDKLLPNPRGRRGL